MIAINKDEKEAIVKQYPNVGIVRTMKQDSKRHHYYMEEARGPVRFTMKVRLLLPDSKQRLSLLIRMRQASISILSR